MSEQDLVRTAADDLPPVVDIRGLAQAPTPSRPSQRPQITNGAVIPEDRVPGHAAEAVADDLLSVVDGRRYAQIVPWQRTEIGDGSVLPQDRVSGLHEVPTDNLSPLVNTSGAAREGVGQHPQLRSDAVLPEERDEAGHSGMRTCNRRSGHGC